MYDWGERKETALMRGVRGRECSTDLQLNFGTLSTLHELSKRFRYTVRPRNGSRLLDIQYWESNLLFVICAEIPGSGSSLIADIVVL